MPAKSLWIEVAQTRRRELRVRLGFGLFLAAACAFLVGVAPAAAWLAAMTLGQVAERLIFPVRPGDHAEPSPRWKAGYFLLLMANALLYTSIGAIIWFGGGQAGKLFALLTPAGALMNAALAMDRAPRRLTIAWAPHILYLVGLPIAQGVASPEPDLLAYALVSCGGAMFVFHVGAAVSRIRRSTDKLHAAVALAEAEKARAERASAAKSDFLATMSHEIRTPMNAVVASAHLLRRTRLSHAQTEHVDMLSNASEQLMGVLNDVLDLAKIESGKLSITYEEVSLRDKLEAAMRLWRPKADEKGLRLECDPGDLPERLLADPLRLQQILFNLLSNAVKFTDTGLVRVSGGRGRDADGETIWIEVSDTGCGMTREACDRVFASFEQGSGGVTRRHGGTGLGLSISRRLAELMGGELTVASRIGQGSTFRLVTPLLAPAAPAPRQDVQSASEPAAISGMQVLLAEDHEVNQRIVRLVLEPLGARVTVAADGREAVALAQSRPFDVILMDMQMPVMGGVEAASVIRLSGGSNADTAILALSANALDDHRAQWAAVGVDVLLTKPVDIEALVAAVCTASPRPRREPAAA